MAAYTSLVDFIDQKSILYSDAVAFENFSVPLTFQELHDHSVIFAAYLQQDLQIQPGACFAIMLPNILQFPIAVCGALRAGLMVMHINPSYTARELSYQLQDSGAVGIIVLDRFAATVMEVLPQTGLKHVIVTRIGDHFSWAKGILLDAYLRYVKHQIPAWSIPDAILYETIFDAHRIASSAAPFIPVPIQQGEVAFLQYTGGTTGIPKGAMLTHANIIANILQCFECIKTKLVLGRDTVIMALPLYHIFSLTGCFFFMAAGAKSLLITDPRDMRLFIKILKNHRFEIFMGLNTLFNGLMRQPDFKKIDFSHLRLVISGGMALQKNVADRWQETTERVIIESYGLTETSPVVAINPVDIPHFTGSVGLPVPLTEISIRDETGRSMAVGESGELWVRGPQVMRGYWQQPTETEAVLMPDGWLRTGDMARIDEKGMIYIIDRKKDMMVVSGFKVFPCEVEQVLMGYKGVKEVAVIGAPSEKTGESVVAFIVLDDAPSGSDPITAQNIIDFCRKSLISYKVPTKVVFCSELPKSYLGKVLRRQLRG